MTSIRSMVLSDIKKIIDEISFEISDECSKGRGEDCLSLLVCSLAEIGTYPACPYQNIQEALDRIIL